MAEGKWKNMKAEEFFGKEEWEQIVEALEAEEELAGMDPGELDMIAAMAEPVDLDKLLEKDGETGDDFTSRATHRGPGTVQ
jgi:hypothetical protein